MDLFDQKFGKSAFVKNLKNAGFSDLDIESEWIKTKTILVSTFFASCYKKLPEKLRLILWEGLDKNSDRLNENASVVFNRLLEILRKTDVPLDFPSIVNELLSGFVAKYKLRIQTNQLFKDDL